MARIRVTEGPSGAVINSDEKGGEAIVARVAHKMLVQAGDEFGGAETFRAVGEHLAAERGLKAGHQKSGGDPFTGNIRDGDGNMCRAELDEIVVVAAHGTSRFADGFDFHAGHGGQGAGKELILHFARDGNLILEALAFVLFFDEPADRAGHFIKGLS